MENHHVMVPPDRSSYWTGCRCEQCATTRELKKNVRTCFHRKFNLGFYFTVLFFLMHNVVYKHNTVSQHCTFMQMTSSIFLLHAAAQFKSKLVQLQVTPRLWTESCRHSALNYKTIWLKPSKQKKNVCTSRALTLPTFLVVILWATLVDWAGHVICMKPSQPGVRL